MMLVLFDPWWHAQLTHIAMTAIATLIVYSFWIFSPDLMRDSSGKTRMDAGTFLALLSSVGQLCSTAKQVSGDILAVWGTAGLIEQLAELLNIELDEDCSAKADVKEAAIEWI